MLRLGYKASAEQFGPSELLDFAVLAEQRGFDSVFISDHFQGWRHTGWPRAVFNGVAGRGRRTYFTHRYGNQRADTHIPLQPRHRRAGLCNTGRRCFLSE